MKTLKRFFLSRATILTTIVLAVGVMLVGSVVPQAFLLTLSGQEKWHADYPLIAPLAERLGLTRLYTHPVFALILALAVISLLLSCIEQVKAAWRRTFGEAPAPAGPPQFKTTSEGREVARTLRSAGYLQVGGGAVKRYLRHPWGLWGNCLLHAGMVVVIASSLWIAVTQQRGLLQIAEGDAYLPDQPWTSTETGLLAPPFVLDETVRLDKLSYDYWPTYGVKSLASTITFLRVGEHPAERSVEINSILGYRGLRIYQGSDFGHAFYLEVTGPSGRNEVVQILINHQDSPEIAGYNDFPDLLGGGRVLLTKYFVDEEKRSLTRENPLLVLRIDEAGHEVGQLPLKPGSAGSIGSYQFRLLKTGRWGSLIFVRLSGIWGIFVGFAVIVLGGVLNYFTPPREVTVREASGDGRVVTWRALKFAEFYDDEFTKLQADLNGERTGG